MEEAKTHDAAQTQKLSIFWKRRKNSRIGTDSEPFNFEIGKKHGSALAWRAHLRKHGGECPWDFEGADFKAEVVAASEDMRL